MQRRYLPPNPSWKHQGTSTRTVRMVTRTINTNNTVQCVSIEVTWVLVYGVRCKYCTKVKEKMNKLVRGQRRIITVLDRSTLLVSWYFTRRKYHINNTLKFGFWILSLGTQQIWILLIQTIKLMVHMCQGGNTKVKRNALARMIMWLLTPKSMLYLCTNDVTYQSSVKSTLSGCYFTTLMVWPYKYPIKSIN